MSLSIPRLLLSNRIIKELYRKEINITALKDTLRYPEFSNIKIEQNVINVIEGKINDEYGIMPVYKIVLDIELAKRRREIQNFPMKRTLLQDKNTDYLGIDGSTKSCSLKDLDTEISTPNNWVYGFRCSLQPYYFTMKLIECFNESGLKIKRFDNFKISVRKDKRCQFQVNIFKEHDTFIVDCVLKKGGCMEYFDTLNRVYACFYKYIHF